MAAMMNPGEPAGSGYFTRPRGRAYVVPPDRLDIERIRAADFPRTRKGFAPEAVRRYLDLVADEVLRLRDQLAAAHAETDRIKRHLRQWQTAHAATCHGAQPRRSACGDWPINQS